MAGAREAFAEWRETPPADRVQPLFRLKALLERDFEELSRSVTLECGKTLAESRGEVRRAIENVEVACGIPSLMQGRALEDIARGIDEFMLRQPVGVAAVIAPFNFPAMIPFWFLPYAPRLRQCGGRQAVGEDPADDAPGHLAPRRGRSAAGCGPGGPRRARYGGGAARPSPTSPR